MNELLIALAANSLMGGAAYAKKSLSASGLAAGIAVGTVIFHLGGPGAWLAMGAFFVSSSILSRYKKSVKHSLSVMWEKGERRDWLQVLANGGVGCAALLLHRITGDQVFIMLFAVSFAAANADTWASEIGALSRKAPVSVLTLQPVPRGTSGGVSPRGLAATLLGSAFIAAIHVAAATWLHPTSAPSCRAVPIIILGGVAGSIIDSILGAAVQGQYYCAANGGMTEKKIIDGTPTTLVRGFAVINNDAVNFLSILGAAGIAFFLERCVFPM